MSLRQTEVCLCRRRLRPWIRPWPCFRETEWVLTDMSAVPLAVTLWSLSQNVCFTSFIDLDIIELLFCVGALKTENLHTHTHTGKHWCDFPAFTKIQLVSQHDWVLENVCECSIICVIVSLCKNREMCWRVCAFVHAGNEQVVGCEWVGGGGASKLKLITGLEGCM